MLKQLLPSLLPLWASLILVHCSSPKNNASNYTKVGGPCEGCEAIYEYGDKALKPIDTLPEFGTNDLSLKITGTVYKKGGKKPAQNVILYIYNTNREGIYASRDGEEGWAKVHGYIRGWVKTDKDGRYTFYTFRPASYPNRKEPEHIHMILKEPQRNEYYIDSYVFDDDPLLTTAERSSLENRGGSGIVQLRKQGEISLIERDIILGLNIPDYE